MERLLTVADAAELLSTTPKRVYSLVESRDEALRLPAVRIGKRLIRFRPADLEAWTERRAS